MAFDPSTARPVQQSGGFDIATAKNVEPEQATTEDPGIFEQFVAPVVAPFAEGAAAVLRGGLTLAESLTIDPANAALQLAGVDAQIPKPSESEFGQLATAGGFLEEGVARDIIRAGGELAAPGAAIGQFTRAAARAVPVAQGIKSGIAQQLSQGTAAADVGLSAVSGAGAEVGQKVGGDVGSAIGAIAAPLAIVVPIQAAKSAASSLLKKAAPTITELKDTARGIYKSLDDSGITVPSRSFDDLADDIVVTLRKEGSDVDLTPKAIALGNRLTREMGNAKTLTELDTLRKVARGAADSLDPSERRLGAIAIQKIDDFLDDIPGEVLGGKEAGKAYRAARDLWQRAKKAEVLEAAVVDAGSQASGLENGLRTQFRAISKKINRGKLKGFTGEEKRAIEKVSNGTNAGNIARFLGKFGILDGVTSRTLTTMGGIGIAGAAGGTGAAAAVPLVGQLSGFLAKRMTQGNAGMASAIVRAGKNNRKVISAYLKFTPKSERQAGELSQLFLANKVPVGMIKSSNPLISDAAIIATLAKQNDKKEAQSSSAP